MRQHINKLMTNKHYEKYSDTIKKVARRNYRKRKGMNTDSRKDVIELIEKSIIVCSNCWIKLDHDLIDPKYPFLS